MNASWWRKGPSAIVGIKYCKITVRLGEIVSEKYCSIRTYQVCTVGVGIENDVAEAVEAHEHKHGDGEPDVVAHGALEWDAHEPKQWRAA